MLLYNYWVGIYRFAILFNLYGGKNMRNGNSSLIPSMKANTLASLVYLFTAVFGILNGFWGFLALVTFVCAVVLIFIEKNSFVRRACVQVIFLHIVLVDIRNSSREARILQNRALDRLHNCCAVHALLLLPRCNGQQIGYSVYREHC